MFFLGEIFVNIDLPLSEPVSSHCGECTACIDVCPTQAIVSPGLVDARRCISYLTIEHQGAIDEDLRPLIGNHIYGCDDCQLICPWNKFAQPSTVVDFDVREGWQDLDVLRALTWQEADFLRFTEGSPVRRIGHAQWLRNAAVVAGNALRKMGDDKSNADFVRAVQEALQYLLVHESHLVREHAQWALNQLGNDQS
jgi:epoxyqueuosine reductase